MARRIINKENISQKARPKLAAVMGKATCYLLEGKLAKNKRQDAGTLKVLAEYSTTHFEIIMDEAAYGGEGELFKSVKLDGLAMDALADILVERQPKRKESTGRPKKYGLQAAAKARRLKGEGKSIRQIAAELGCSTFTVQRLLK